MMQPGDYEAINLRTGTRTALRVLPDKVLKFSQGQWKLTSSHEYEIVLTVRQYVNNQKVYEVSDIPRVKCDTMDLPPDWKQIEYCIKLGYGKTLHEAWKNAAENIESGNIPLPNQIMKDTEDVFLL